GDDCCELGYLIVGHRGQEKRSPEILYEERGRRQDENCCGDHSGEGTCSPYYTQPPCGECLADHRQERQVAITESGNNHHCGEAHEKDERQDNCVQRQNDRISPENVPGFGGE